MSRSRRGFSESFKADAVGPVISSGQPVAKVARGLGWSPRCIASYLSRSASLRVGQPDPAAAAIRYISETVGGGHRVAHSITDPPNRWPVRAGPKHLGDQFMGASNAAVLVGDHGIPDEG